MPRSYFHTLISVVVLIGTLSQVALASNSGITYQGRILKPDGSPLSGHTTQFKLQLRTPDSQNCLMYEEIQSLDLSQTAGSFSLTINDGTGARIDSTGLTLDQIFANHGSVSLIPSTCSSGTGLYTPNSSDGRVFAVLFKDETMVAWEPVPAMKINYVPFAVEAKQIAGFTINNLVRVAESDGTLDSVSPLNNVQYSALLALANGTSTQYVQNGASGVLLPSVASAPASPSAGQVWYNSGSSSLQYSDGTVTRTLGTAGGSVTSVATGTGLTGGPITSTGTISLAAIGAAGSGTKLSYDVYGRVTGAAVLIESDIPTLSTAGKVVGTAITSGTIGGSTSMNTTGTVTAATVSGTQVTARNVQVFDSGANKVTIQTPATLAGSYSLTLPPTAGTSGYVLSTDGTGVLNWVSATPANFSGSLSGDVTGTQAATVVSAVAGSTAAQVHSAELLANAATAVNTPSTLMKRDGSGNFAATNATLSKVILNDSQGTPNTATLQAPAAITTSYVLKMPTGLPASAGYVLTSDTSGNLSWVLGSSGSVTSVTASPPLASSGGAAPNLSIPKSTGSVDGYLAATDFAAFNAKQSATLTNTHLWVGNGSNVATDVAMSGDAALSNTGAISVTGLRGKTVSASAPTTAGQVLRYDGTNWTPNFVSMADLRSTVTGASSATSCTAGQTLTYTSVSDNLTCSTISIGDSQITYASQAQNKFFASPNGSAGAPTYRAIVASDLPVTGAGAPFVNGGNAFGSASNLGNNDNFDLSVKTNNLTRMTVTAGGNVGIGPTSPSTKLQVAGSITVGDGGETCSGGSFAGAVRYNGGNVQFCNGTAWSTLGVAGAGITALTGDVTASGTGSVAATVAQVGGVTAANVALGANAANAAVSTNTASKIVIRDASGNFAAGTAALNSVALGSNGSVVYKDGTTNTVSVSAPSTVSSSYSMKWPAAVAASAGQVLASDMSGNLSWSSMPTSLPPSGAAGGDLSGTYPNPGVATVGASTAANIHTAELAANAATASNTNSTIVLRDGSGNFASNVGTFNGVTLKNAASLLNIVNPVGGAWTMTLPQTAGTSGQVMQTNGSGVMTWTTPLTSTTGFVNGGNSFGATSNLGNNDNFDLNVKTNNLARLTVTAAGSVGIGTTAPSSALHVAGTTGINWSAVGDSSGLLTVGSGASAAGASLWVNTPSFNSTNQSGLGVTGSFYPGPPSTSTINLNAYGPKFAGAGSNLAFSVTNGASLNEAMRINSTGNVGIGTTDPVFGDTTLPSSVHKFGVTGDGSASPAAAGAINLANNRAVASSGDILGALQFLSVNNGAGGGDRNTSIISGALEGAGGTDGFGGVLSFQTKSNNSASAPSERMRINSNGNVGIGTTAPGAPLDVKGAIRMSGATSGYVGFQPAAVAGSTVWTLPSADGSANQVLKTDGSGNLGWASAGGGGTVTSVTSANTDIGVATTTTTPVLTLNSGTGANQILKLNASSQIPAVDGSLITSLNASNISTGTLPVARGGTGTTTFANYSVIASNASGNQVAVPGSTSNTMLQWTVTGPSWSSATYPSATTANQLLYSSGTNTVGQLATANNGVLSTNGTGVPAITSTLPSAVQTNITSTGTITSGTWNASAIGATYGGTGQTTFAVGDLLYASSTTALSRLPASTSGYVLTSTGAGSAPSWQAAAGGGGTALSGLTTDTKINYANNNMLLGQNSGTNGTITGTGNIAMGPYSMYTLTSATNNTALGYQSMDSAGALGSSNTAVGHASMYFNTGSGNTAIGDSALYVNGTTTNAVAIGTNAGYGSTSSGGIFIGYDAGYGFTGNGNIAIGQNILFTNATSGAGANNTIIGDNAASNNVSARTAAGNTSVGAASIQAISNGTNNVVLGYNNGNTLTTGSSNILIGTGLSTPLATTSNFLNIGNTIYGNTSTGNVGIGTAAPSNLLSVSPSQYSTGTASQSTTTVTGVGTTWTSAMVGSQFVFANGVSAGTITAFGGPTSLTVTASQTVASQSYNIAYTGLQVTASGNVGIGTTAPTGIFDLRGGSAGSGSGSPITIVGQNSFYAGGAGGSVNITAGSATCFAAQTKVRMSDGQLKNIEDIEIGDSVMSFDLASNQPVPSRVSHVFHHTPEEMSGDSYLSIETETGRKLQVTTNHPILVNGEWKEAGQIKLNDSLINEFALSEKVTEIKKRVGRIPTFNLEVEDYHVYFAEGLLVHNKAVVNPGGSVYLAAGTGSITGNVILGMNSSGTALGNVGIGTTSPMATLDVNGQIYSRSKNNAASTAFDFSAGNTQYTSTACSGGAAWTLSNMQDGGNYSVVVKNTTHTGACTFAQGGITNFYYRPVNAMPQSGHVIYTFTRVGTDVYVSWIDGFQ